jgi:hypothetical protein
MTGNYKGQRLITHGGGTSGFTSDLSFMPDGGLGIAILSNAQNAKLFVAGVRSRILELVLGQPADPRYSARLEETRKTFQRKAAVARPFDKLATARHLGHYKNTSLGDVSLTEKGGRLIFTFSGFASELRPLDNETYLLWDPPLAGAVIRFSKNYAANPTFVLDGDAADIPEKHAFVRVADPSRASVRAIEQAPRADHQAHLLSSSGTKALMQVMNQRSHGLGTVDLMRIMERNHVEKALVKSRAYLYGPSGEQADGISDEYAAVQRENISGSWDETVHGLVMLNALANIPAAKAIIELAGESPQNAFAIVSDRRAYGKVA